MSLYSRFKKHLLSQRLLSPDDKLLLGLSGGLDSTVLLHLLDRLRREWDLKLVGAHVNYHLRGKASDQDEAFLRQLLGNMGLSLEVLSVSLSSKAGIQEKARQIRHDYFEKVAAQHHCQKIVLAHHAEDQAETFLMKLLRGAGLQGLGGMEQKRQAFHSKFQLIRPLLPFSKEELKDYARQEKIRWREDVSNQKTDYLRNFIRLKILENLKKKNPQVIRKISEAVELIQEENEWMNKHVQRLLKGKVKSSAGELKVPLAWIRKQAFPLRKRLYLHLLKEKIPLMSPSRQHLLALDEMVMEDKKQMKLSLSMGYGARLQKGDLCFVKWRRQKLDKRGFFC